MGRYLLVHLDADSTGDGYGKHADAVLYWFTEREDAELIARALAERELEFAQIAGGYPGKAWVIDTQNPDDFGDTQHLIDDVTDWAEFMRERV